MRRSLVGKLLLAAGGMLVPWLVVPIALERSDRRAIGVVTVLRKSRKSGNALRVAATT